MKNPTDTLLTAIAAALSAWVLLASLYLGYAQAEHRWVYAAALVLIGAGWLLRQLRRPGGEGDPAARRSRHQATLSIALAAAMLGAAMLGQLDWFRGQDSHLTQRLVGVMMGVTVMVFANVIPKRIDSANCAALRRAVGWALVLGGLGDALSWLLLPLAYANQVGMLILLTGTLYALGRVVWSRVKQPPSTPSQSS